MSYPVWVAHITETEGAADLLDVLARLDLPRLIEQREIDGVHARQHHQGDFPVERDVGDVLLGSGDEIQHAGG